MPEYSIYKIHKDGKFSSGGTYPKFTRLGKTWNCMGHVNSHLKFCKRYNDDTYSQHKLDVYKDAELLEITFCIETGWSQIVKTKMSDIMKTTKPELTKPQYICKSDERK